MPSFQASSRTKRAGKRSASEVWVPDCARHSEADAEMDDLEVLMEEPDPDIFKWLTGAADLPAEFDTPVFRRMKQFHTHFAPKFA